MEFYACPLCEAVFDTNKELMAHMKIYLGPREHDKDIPKGLEFYACIFCEAVFDTNKELIAHMKETHPNQRLVQPLT